MRLSNDGQILLHVSNYDIINGLFYIPEGLTSIGRDAFRDCTSLTDITLPEGLTSIGVWAFFGCTGLTEITLPEGLTSIGDNVFRGCTGLTEITLPEGLTSIGGRAFWRCTGLTDITFPKGLTSIGGGAFQDCTGLTDITLPEGLTSIGGSAFWRCTGLTDITFPKGLTSIDESAFNRCTGLTDITFPKGLTSIGNWAFNGCTGLTEITLHEGLTSIGGWAFNGCTGLTDITLPEGLTSIGRLAFQDCTALQIIVINTSSSEEVERIKNLLPEEHRSKVNINPVYNDVIAFQQKKYEDSLHNPMLGLYKEQYALLIKYTKFPIELIIFIVSFETKLHQGFKNKIKHLKFPTSTAEFEKYKSDVGEILTPTKSLDDLCKQSIEATEVLLIPMKVEPMLCRTKLLNYCLYIENKKQITQNSCPTFFINNSRLSLEIDEKLTAVKKVIELLNGNGEIEFTKEEVTRLNQGFIGDTLNKYNITLPQEVDVAVMPAGNNVSTL